MFGEIGRSRLNRQTKKRFLTATFYLIQLSQETILCASIEIQGIGNEAAGAGVLCLFFLITYKMERKERGL